MSTVLYVNRGSKAIQRLVKQLEDKTPLHQAMADGARVEIQNHFIDLAQKNRNPYGKRSTFWARMFRGTTAVATAAAGFVRMPREVAQRFFGGVIKPILAKFLAIPARAEAYGKSPREFDNLRAIKFPSGALALVEADATKIRKTAKGLRPGQEVGGGVLFWLKKSVTQPPDRNALPTETLIGKAALRAAEEYFNRRRN